MHKPIDPHLFAAMERFNEDINVEILLLELSQNSSDSVSSGSSEYSYHRYRPVLNNIARHDVAASAVAPSEPDGLAARLPKI